MKCMQAEALGKTQEDTLRALRALLRAHKSPVCSSASAAVKTQTPKVMSPGRHRQNPILSTACPLLLCSTLQTHRCTDTQVRQPAPTQHRVAERPASSCQQRWKKSLQPVRQAYLQQGVLRDPKGNVRILRAKVRQHLQDVHGFNPRVGPLSCLRPC